MTPITRQQREALKRVYDRTELYMPVNNDPMAYLPRSYPLYHDPQEMEQEPATYRQFRRTVQTECYSQGLMVPWCNMWLGIEPDGYTHS